MERSRQFRSFKRRLLVVSLALSVFPARAQQTVLTRVDDVRQLSSTEASKARPVRLKGTVTALSGWKNSFFLQDSSGAISVDRTDSAEVLAGDEVEITGVSGPGMFAVAANQVTVLGRGRYPEPRRSAYRDLASGRDDGRWVEILGVVRTAAVSESWRRQVLLLTMTIDGVGVTARIYSFPQRDFAQLVDATVRVRGVCGTVSNQKRQMMGVRIFVPSLEHVQVLESPPDPFSLPALSLDRLFQFAPVQRLEHRVRILATLSYQDLRRGRLYLQEGDQGAVAHSSQFTPMTPGSRVEVVGFVAPGQYPATLEDAIFRKAGEGQTPSPVNIRAAEAIQEEDGFTFAPYNGLLVRTEGQLIEKVRHGDGQIWLMRDGDHMFQASIAGAAADRLAYVRDGSRVRLAGICSVEMDRNLEPQSVTILLRSATDVALIEKSWLNVEGSLWLIGFLVVAGLCMFAWVLQVRHGLRPPGEKEPPNGAQLTSRFHRTARFAGLLTGLIGGLVLVGGWGLDIEILRSLSPAYVTVKPNTALGLIVAGLALWSYGRRSAGSRLLNHICVAIVVLLGLLTLTEYISGADLRIDQLLFRDAVGMYLPGRMAAITAVVFLLAGCSLLLVSRKRWVFVSQGLAALAGLLCLLNLVGNLYGETALFGIASEIKMAIHTSAALVILCSGILLLEPDRGFIAVLSSPAPGGLMARRLLPAAVLVPVVLGWLSWQGQVRGLIDNAFSLTLFASSIIVAFAFLVWTSAGLLNRSDIERSQAETELRVSEKRYRTVVESLPHMIWTCLPDGRCDYLSPRWITYTGVPEEDQLGQGWLEPVHPEDRDRIRALWTSGNSAQGLDAEYRLRNASGAYRWFRAQAVPLLDSKGKTTAWFGGSTDIEALKMTEAALRDSEASFRQLADAMPQMVWTAKPDGNVDYYNRRWYEFSGTTFEQTRDWGWQPILHPLDVRNCVELWTHSVATGAPYEVEYRFKRASDGVYRWHLGRAEPVRNANGDIVRWFGTCTDIEDYKQAESAIRGLNEDLENRVNRRTAELARANGELAQSRAQVQSVLDGATQVAIIATDMDGVIRMFNSGAEKMLGYQASQVVGHCTPEILHDRAEVAERSVALSCQLDRPVEGFDVIFAAARQGGSEQREWTYVRKDLSTLHVSLSVTAIRTSGGAITGFLGIATDITSRKALEQELRLDHEKAEQANRAKSDFLASMSHEIRTPLNSILGISDVLWETDLSAEQRQYVEVFRRAGSNLLALINDILDLSKIEAGHFELEHISFDLEEVVDQVVELFGPKARGKGVVLLSRFSPQVASSLTGDPVRVRQVLINLVENAVKFTDSGEVVLAVSNSGSGTPGLIEFVVSDTGIGIPADKLATIFDDFTQSDSSTTRKYGGTGLGLGISRRIVERMGGRLTVTSSPGQGSTFGFIAKFEPGEERELPAGANGFEGKRALIIDNSLDCPWIAETLIDWGMEADCYEMPVAALTAVSEKAYDVVFLDSDLPTMSGCELAAVIRKLAPGMPIVMLASEGNRGDSAKWQGLGLAAYAIKPVTRSGLLRLLSLGLKTIAGAGQHGSPAGTDALIVPASPLRILVADDSADNRLLMQALLKASPHILTFVENGEAAVQEFDTGGPFDLVLMDIQMPVMDGLTATRTIRAMERKRGLPPIAIIAFTAHARAEDENLSQAAGCTAHITKPVSKQKLLAAIEKFGQSSGPIWVKIADGLEDLVPGYLADRKIDASGMMPLLGASDYDRLRTLAHNLAGTGTSYGFPELTRLGGEMESSAKRSDKTLLTAQIAQLDDYLSRVQLVSA